MTDEVLARLDAILVEAKRTNGRVSTLESQIAEMTSWRAEHTDWSARTLTAINQRLDTISDGAVAEIEAAVGRVLDQRETASKAAAYDALQERFGPDPEGQLGRWSAVVRLVRDSATKAWLVVITAGAGAGVAFVLDRILT